MIETQKKFHVRSGYSILELLLVFGIIAAVMGGIFFLGSQLLNMVKKNTARTTLFALNTAIQQFHTDTSGHYPHTLKDLVARPQGDEFNGWDGPYWKKSHAVPKDPWNHPYVYKETPSGKHEYELYTKTPGGAILSVHED